MEKLPVPDHVNACWYIDLKHFNLLLHGSLLFHTLLGWGNLLNDDDRLINQALQRPQIPGLVNSLLELAYCSALLIQTRENHRSNLYFLILQFPCRALRELQQIIQIDASSSAVSIVIVSWIDDGSKLYLEYRTFL